MTHARTKVWKLEDQDKSYQQLLKDHQLLTADCYEMLEAVRECLNDGGDEAVLAELRWELDDAIDAYQDSHDNLMDILHNKKKYSGKYTVLPPKFVEECMKYDIDL